MYFNLKNELKNNNISIKKLAKELQINLFIMNLKINGLYKIKFEEAIRIKRIINSNLNLEELFSTKNNLSLLNKNKI